MRVLLLIAIVIVVGCAGHKNDPVMSGRPSSEAMIVGGSEVGSARIVRADGPHVTLLASSVDPVWKAMVAAYDSVGLPLTVIDYKQHVIGNQGLKIRQKLGNVALSKYIDCGNAQGGASADSYDVFLTVISNVRPNEPVGTEIATTVEAAAKPLLYSQEYSRCKTTTELEKRIASYVRAALAR